MAWLQGLAGKAEGFLNKMDQTAAVSLQQPGSTEKLNASTTDETWNTLHRIRRSGSNSSTVSDFTDGSSGRRIGGGGQAAHTIDETSDDFTVNSIRRTASHQDFEWPSSSPTASPSRSKQHKRSSSGKKSVDLFAELNASTAGEGRKDGADGLSINRSTNDSPLAVDVDGDSSDVLPSASTESELNGSGPALETVARENQLMKSELQSQSRELSMALNRVKRAEQGWLVFLFVFTCLGF